jgi:exopolysaccharide biosynthesis polyprenyl glycosylphosphotransferase
MLISAYNVLFWHHFNRWAGVTGSVAALITLWLTLSYLLGRYSTNERRKHPWSIIWVACVVALITMALTWLGLVEDIRALPKFTLSLLAVAIVISCAVEFSLELLARKPKQWLLVVSKNEEAVLQHELASQSTRTSSSLAVFSNVDEALAALSQAHVDEGIVVGEAAALEDEAIQTLLHHRSRGVDVVSLLDWCERYLQRVPPELLSSRWLLLAEGFQLCPGQTGWRLKRLGDLVIATSLLALTSPLLLACGILIKLEDGGPILYHQVRTGLYGQPFRIWKLRSMHRDAERKGARWASERDPRITSMGRWLRLLRIDELPQLINVLAGDMSLIGPRPERPEFELNLEQAIPHYRMRHSTRPGLSGWAQVCFNYGASESDSRTKLSYDLYYLRNFSLALDVLIALKTIRLLARAEGATPKTSGNR